MIIFIYDKFWTPKKFKIALSLNAQNSSPCLFSVFNEDEHFRYCWRAKAIAPATGCVKYCFKFLIHTALRRGCENTLSHCNNCSIATIAYNLLFKNLLFSLLIVGMRSFSNEIQFTLRPWLRLILGNEWLCLIKL